MDFILKHRKYFFIAFSTLGILLSAYALQHHYLLKSQGSTQAACNINSFVNCDAVAASAYSEFAGIPLGAYGVAFFLSILLLYLNSIFAFHPKFFTLGIFSQKAAKGDGQALLGTLAVGLLSVFILGGISILKIGNICITCIGVYICVFVTAHLAAIDYKNYLPIKSGDLFNGLFKAALYVILAVAISSRLATPSTSTTQKPTPMDSMQGQSVQFDISTSPYKGFGEDYRSGLDDAPVTIVEFADLECPACQKMFELLNEVKAKYKNDVRVVFKNFPLHPDCNPAVNNGIHKFACDAAFMARCAGLYGYFWEYTELAFTNQNKMNETTIQQWAEQVGLTQDQIAACESSPSIKEKIKMDAKEGQSLGITGTPTVFINGKRYSGGLNIDTLEQTIQSALQAR